MKRSELEKHLGEKVVITLYDGKIIFGYLRKTGDEMFKDNPDLYFWYRCLFLYLKIWQRLIFLKYGI